MEGEWGNSGPAYFLLSFFLISHSFLNSIISCIFKNKIVSRKWMACWFQIILYWDYWLFLAEHWDQLVGIIYWLYFLLMNLTSNSIQILNAGCQANPWKSDFKLSLEWKSVCIAQFWEKREPKKIMMLCENCSKFALLCILVGVLASRRIVKLSKASGWYWHTINLKGLPTLP